MSATKQPSEGGAYVVDKDGKRKRVEWTEPAAPPADGEQTDAPPRRKAKE